MLLLVGVTGDILGHNTPSYRKRKHMLDTEKAVHLRRERVDTSNAINGSYSILYSLVQQVVSAVTGRKLMQCHRPLYPPRQGILSI